MNNLNEKEQLIIKSMIEDKISEAEKAKSEAKTTREYLICADKADDLRKILNKIEQA